MSTTSRPKAGLLRRNPDIVPIVAVGQRWASLYRVRLGKVNLEATGDEPVLPSASSNTTNTKQTQRNLTVSSDFKLNLVVIARQLSTPFNISQQLSTSPPSSASSENLLVTVEDELVVEM